MPWVGWAVRPPSTKTVAQFLFLDVPRTPLIHPPPRTPSHSCPPPPFLCQESRWDNPYGADGTSDLDYDSHVDAATGATFYRNAATGAVQWELPDRGIVAPVRPPAATAAGPAPTSTSPAASTVAR
jgi:hypothetical protein